MSIGCALAETGKSEVIDEDFEGAADTAPNPEMWQTTGGHVLLDGDGHVVFDSSAENGYQSLASEKEFTPVANKTFASITFENLGGPAMLFNMVAGLLAQGDQNTADYIYVRTDMGNDVWTIDIKSDGHRASLPTQVPKSVRGTWKIEWRDGAVQIYLDEQLEFDSNSTPPAAGDIWQIPTLGLRPYIGGSGGQIMKLDRIRWQEVPVGNGEAK
ncbi:hypothetical protein BH09VER1_BH09VER1_17340 [soil metagenome]